MKTTNPLENLYRKIAEPLCRYPEELRVNTRVADPVCTLVASCNPVDQGRLIGVGGKMYKACDYLIKVTGRRIGYAARLIIESDFRSTHELRQFVPKDEWLESDNEYIEATLRDVVGYVEDSPIEIQMSNVSRNGTVVLMRTSEALTEQMRTSLDIVMNAIGKSRGRFIYLEFAKTYESKGQNIGAR
jgi:predicted RNA-binding protein YlqC (UPF0109 family)